jgi:hypothetical protein
MISHVGVDIKTSVSEANFVSIITVNVPVDGGRARLQNVGF